MYRAEGTYFRYSERETKVFAHLYFPLPVYGRGSEGDGPFLQIQNYKDIGEDSMGTRNYLYRFRSKMRSL